MLNDVEQDLLNFLRRVLFRAGFFGRDFRPNQGQGFLSHIRRKPVMPEELQDLRSRWLRLLQRLSQSAEGLALFGIQTGGERFDIRCGGQKVQSKGNMSIKERPGPRKMRKKSAEPF